MTRAGKEAEVTKYGYGFRGDTSIRNKNRYNQPINPNNPRHNNRNDILDNQIRTKNTHRGNPNPRLRCPIRSSKAYTSVYCNGTTARDPPQRESKRN